MRLVIQRVNSASVTVDNEIVGKIGHGMLILVGVTHEDTPDDVRWLAAKTAALRIFDDSEGVMNLSVIDVGGEILAVSQFTLHASTRRGNRPSYIHAARPEIALPLYDLFCDTMHELTGRKVEKGVFGAHMLVDLRNDGPVTIIIDSKNRE